MKTQWSEPEAPGRLASTLRKRGVRLSRLGDTLRVRAPAGTLTPELKAAIARRREDLLRLLQAPATDDGPIGTDRSCYPLSSSQRQIWFEQLRDPGDSRYNVPVVVRVGRRVGMVALEQALRWIVGAHETLRARFPLRADTAVMDIAPDRGALALSVVDVPPGAADADLRQAIQAFVRRPFELERGDLFRACLFQSAGRDSTLAISVHHIVADGWSMGILLRDFQLAYAACAAGEPLRAARPSARSYGEFATSQTDPARRSAMRSRAEAAAARTSNVPDLRLPYDVDGSGATTHRGGLCATSISAADLARLQLIARRCGTTLAGVVSAAYMLLLFDETSQAHFTIGLDTSGRDDDEWSDVVGHFVNQVMMIADLAGNPTLAEMIGRAGRAVVDAQAVRDVPFDMLVKAARELTGSERPLFRAKLVLQPPLEHPLTLPDLELLQFHDGTCKFELLLNVWLSARGAELAIEYDRGIFHVTTGERLVRRLWHTLASFQPDALSVRVNELRDRLARAEGLAHRQFSFHAAPSRGCG